MKMQWKTWMLGIVLSLVAAGLPTRAQAPAQTSDKHVVSLDELNKDAAQPAETRQADEAAIRELLSTEAGQQALKQAKVEYKQVDKAIGQLNDADLAKIAERSRDAQKDFAASGLSSRLLIVIILIVILIIVLAAVFG
jgi:uncharacterized membrane protein YdfJ with MMPL/SSD domain